MKDMKISNEVFQSKKRKLYRAASALSLVILLTGCSEPEKTPAESYDVVDNINGESDFKELTQKLDVPGETFKLVTTYECDSAAKREWRITSDKFLSIHVETEGLPEGTKVYIDNVHADASIKSEYAVMDGIIQDTMDDRIHNSQLIGFPVSDTVSYDGVFAIEGSNEQFISGSFYGMSGYSHGTIEQKRRTESEYVDDYGVYASKFQFVYDLLIKSPGDEDYRNASVKTDFIVKVSKEKEKEKTK